MKTTKGLGTGLGALFGDAAFDESAAADFDYVPLARIEPRKDQPRTVFEQDLIGELSTSIREHGLLTPLLVRRMGSDYFQIIAGERRWRAAREAGLVEVPVRIIEADNQKAFELALVENLQREDLSPIEEARGYRSLMEEFGMTQEDVSQRVGKSRSAVANSLRLLSLPAELTELVLRGELAAGSARALLALSDSDSMRTAAQMAVDGGMSVRDVEALVRRLNRKSQERSASPAETTGIDADEACYIADAQARLETALGRKVTIKPGKGKGRIELEYYSQADFNDLYDALIDIGGK